MFCFLIYLDRKLNMDNPTNRGRSATRRSDSPLTRKKKREMEEEKKLMENASLTTEQCKTNVEAKLNLPNTNYINNNTLKDTMKQPDTFNTTSKPASTDYTKSGTFMDNPKHLFGKSI